MLKLSDITNQVIEQERIDSVWKDENGVPLKKTKIYASDLGRCHRQVWYELKGFPRKPINAKAARRMAVGKFLETLEGEALKSAGLDVREQVKIDGIIGAKPDWIVTKPDESIVVAECKTIPDYSMRAFLASTDRLQWAKDNYLGYLKQNIFYSNELQEKLQSDKCELHFVGVTGEAESLPFTLKDVPDVLQETLSDIDYLLKMPLDGDGPSRQEDRDEYPCTYCDYCDMCWEGAEKEKIVITESDAQLVKEFLELKSEESRIKKSLDKIKPKINQRLEELKSEIITDKGGVELKERKKVSYKNSINILRDILTPLGLFEEILEVSNDKIDTLLKTSDKIKESDLASAKSVKIETYISQIKIKGSV
jgi:hypothetical protein